MILAAYGDGLYKLLFLGHMVSFLVAFAPAVINPILGAQTKADGDQAARCAWPGTWPGNGRRIHFPALIALGASGSRWCSRPTTSSGFDDTWVSLAFLVWLAICGVVLGGCCCRPSASWRPATRRPRRWSSGRPDRHACSLLVMLYLMIWKPGA